jgi:hypothetical protein
VYFSDIPERNGRNAITVYTTILWPETLSESEYCSRNLTSFRQYLKAGRWDDSEHYDMREVQHSDRSKSGSE